MSTFLLDNSDLRKSVLVCESEVALDSSARRTKQQRNNDFFWIVVNDDMIVGLVRINFVDCSLFVDGLAFERTIVVRVQSIVIL